MVKNKKSIACAFLIFFCAVIPRTTMGNENAVVSFMAGLCTGAVLIALTQATSKPAEPSVPSGLKTFFKAAQNNNIEDMKAALQNEEVLKNINTGDANNQTALYYAARYGYLAIVEMLLAAKANPDVKLNDGTTPLITASRRGHTNVVRALVNANANVHQKDDRGENALLASASDFNPGWATARYLLDEAGANIEDLEKKRVDSNSIDRFYCRYITEKYHQQRNETLGRVAVKG